MSLVRYQPDRTGMRDLGAEPFIGEATMAAARAVEAWARADNPDGDYIVTQAGVPTGRQNEVRAGAVVAEIKYGMGPQHRTLETAAREARA